MSVNIIDEKTTKEEINADYKSYPAVKGDLDSKPWYESRYAPIFYEIPLHSKVLDVGCNDGVFMQMIKEKRLCDITGIDISEVALEEAKKKGQNAVYGDVENMTFEDESFDVVICAEVLSHLFDPSKALKEIRRVLKKNGILLGSCPHKNLETYVWEDKRMHRRYYDVDVLHQALSESFERVWVKEINGAQFSMGLAESFLGNKTVEMIFKCGNIKTLGWDAALQDRSILRCWFGFTQAPGDVYYRMSGYCDKMQKLGAETHYDSFDENDFEGPGEWCKKIRYIPSEKRFTNSHIVNQLETLLRASDMSIFQVTPSRDILLLLTTARLGVIKKPMLVEIDDWIFDLPPYNTAAKAYQPNSDMEAVAYDHLKLSDAIVCSTQYLKGKLELLNLGKPIYVIQNSIDFDVWDNLKRHRKDHEANPNLIRILYTGCSNHSGDLEIVVEPMKALLDEFENLEFISLPFPATDSIKNSRYKRWGQWVGMSKFPQMVADMEPDIGIAPLMDNELNRAKSNLRWLEYSALKIPTIASDIQPFHISVQNKKTGILVSNSEKDWYGALKVLIVEKGERAAIGQKAYEEVKAHYNMNNWAESYLSLLKEIKHGFIRDLGRIRT